ncbi:hypothetical protein J31TS4_42440 [Paenibacillus sp. J31TS4]|uniref:DNA-directed RNA polymerase subunit beta n=1 Tax=Paenibacillus sp. J31TS4 TaxID=2807195 RepID=UPI001B2ACE76|nr:DNA-directed RNA polymerase subunit beta [Paenibacillus sp. J31TS4]GIP40964.1 hypothetical protein J31TS4_42440 [Paenibacillus sp. J31TS4]
MTDTKPTPAPTRKKWAKRTWAIIRPLLVPLACLLALWVGMVAGYVYVGKQPMSEVWNLQTWKHLFDLVF